MSGSYIILTFVVITIDIDYSSILPIHSLIPSLPLVNRYTHDNQDGIRVEFSEVSNVVIIEDVTSKYNVKDGIQIRDSGVTVKDSTFSHNDNQGIRIAGEEMSYPTQVKFEGTVSSHHNREDGIEVVNSGIGGGAYSDVNVKGVLNTYLNGRDGLVIRPNADSNFIVEDHGSFNSCQNYVDTIFSNGFDIRNSGQVTFEGTKGYTCDTKIVLGSGDLPDTCTPCPDCN